MAHNSPAGLAPQYYTSEEARSITRHNDRKAFLDAVHRDGIPHVRLNQRRLLFPVAAFHAWLDRRTIGTARPSIETAAFRHGGVA